MRNPFKSPATPKPVSPTPLGSPSDGLENWLVLSEPPPSGVKVSIEILVWVLKVSYQYHQISKIDNLQDLGRAQGMRLIADLMVERYLKDNNISRKDLPHVLLQSQGSGPGYLAGTSRPTRPQ